MRRWRLASRRHDPDDDIWAFLFRLLGIFWPSEAVVECQTTPNFSASFFENRFGDKHIKAI